MKDKNFQFRKFMNAFLKQSLAGLQLCVFGFFVLINQSKKNFDSNISTLPVFLSLDKFRANSTYYTTLNTDICKVYMHSLLS